MVRRGCVAKVGPFKPSKTTNAQFPRIQSASMKWEEHAWIVFILVSHGMDGFCCCWPNARARELILYFVPKLYEVEPCCRIVGIEDVPFGYIVYGVYYILLYIFVITLFSSDCLVLQERKQTCLLVLLQRTKRGQWWQSFGTQFSAKLFRRPRCRTLSLSLSRRL